MKCPDTYSRNVKILSFYAKVKLFNFPHGGQQEAEDMILASDIGDVI